jgi:tripartite-type tricarboxylate transporter receptor subunit TctC
MTSIFYRDLAPALRDLGEGSLDIYLHALSVLIPQAQAGRARLLAVTGQRRAAAAPDLSTVAELGFSELRMEGLCGFFGPRGIALAIRKRVAADVMAIASEAAVQKRLEVTGQTAHPGTSEDFETFLADNRQQLMAYARTAGNPVHN